LGVLVLYRGSCQDFEDLKTAEIKMCREVIAFQLLVFWVLEKGSEFCWRTYPKIAIIPGTSS